MRFEIEKVIGVSNEGTYQIQWSPCWVSKSHLVGCEHLIKEFLQQQAEGLGTTITTTTITAATTAGQCGDVTVDTLPLADQGLNTIQKLQQTTTEHAKQHNTQRNTHTALQTAEHTAQQLQQNQQHEHLNITKHPQEHPKYDVHDTIPAVAQETELNRVASDFIESSTVGGNMQEEYTEYPPDVYTVVPTNAEYNVIKIEEDDEIPDATGADLDFYDIDIQQQQLQQNEHQQQQMNTEQQEYLSTNNSLTWDTTAETTQNNDRTVTHTDVGDTSKPQQQHSQATKKRKITPICELCDKQFSNATSLRIHMRSHTGDRPYACSYCDRAFAQRGDLQRHVRTHTGVKPFVCTVCGKGFSRKITLKQHGLTVHKYHK